MATSYDTGKAILGTVGGVAAASGFVVVKGLWKVGDFVLPRVGAAVKAGATYQKDKNKNAIGVQPQKARRPEASLQAAP